MCHAECGGKMRVYTILASFSDLSNHSVKYLTYVENGGKTILTSLSFPDTKFFSPTPCGLVEK